ncbi:hypothetical protein [Paraburkholderia caribensis]|uniref:hypothetical protein n=1 Tax=Paraburkholderia caribensis TaxID=75105 RepID=UPI0034D1EEB3
MLRHIADDWGIVSEDDKRQNNLPVMAGLRLISIYRLPDQTRILVITEWDRTSAKIERLDDVVPVTEARPAQPATRFNQQGT